MIIRGLRSTDYKQYMELIGSSVSESHFDNFVTDVLSENHIIVVLEDSLQNIIGTGTLLIEEKLTYGGCRMGHIENVLIDGKHRGMGHGGTLVSNLLDVAKTKGCYRIDLNCNSELEEFYRRNDFARDSISMSVLVKENFR